MGRRFRPAPESEGDRTKHGTVASGFGFLRNGRVAPWLCEAHDQNTAVIEAAAAASGRLARHYDGVIGPWFLSTFLERTGLDPLQYAVSAPTTRGLP